MMQPLRILWAKSALVFLGLGLFLLFFPACQDEPAAINSVVLAGGAYVRIENREDSTSLAALNSNVFSLEIWAAGDILPFGVGESPALFTIGNEQGGDEIGIYRLPTDSSQIFVFIGNQFMGFYSIPGCDWNDPEIFTQVVVTYDGTRVSVYGNGESLGSAVISRDLNIGASDALIGADWDALNDETTLNNFWYGAIDEVRLWTTVLLLDEIEFHSENPAKLTRNYSDAGLDPLLGLWRFNEEPSDGIVIDGSGNGNVGVLNPGNGTLAFSPDGA